jgi:membrane-bound lytic murein transglycosylase A
MRFVILVPKSLDPVARGRKMPLPDARPSAKIAKLFSQVDPLKAQQKDKKTAAKPAETSAAASPNGAASATGPAKNAAPAAAQPATAVPQASATPAAAAQAVPLPGTRPNIEPSRGERRHHRHYRYYRRDR